MSEEIKYCSSCNKDKEIQELKQEIRELEQHLKKSYDDMWEEHGYERVNGTKES